MDVGQLRSQEAFKEKEDLGISESFIQEHQSIIDSISSRVISQYRVPSGVEFSDLVSWGIEGLIKAKKRFKGDQGSTFKTYAFYRIRGEILDRIRREWHYKSPSDVRSFRQEVRERIVDYAEAESNEPNNESASKTRDRLLKNSALVYMLTSETLRVVQEKERQSDPESRHVDQNYEGLWSEVSDLDEDEQEIVDLMYKQGKKQNEVSDLLKYSKSKVCRIHNRVLEKLKRRLETKGLL